ncbi:hypothetical protein AZ017_005040, partial [Klebsiella pneumoniae]
MPLNLRRSPYQKKMIFYPLTCYTPNA